MEIILIRHTTPKVSKGICYGHADVRVDANFREEAKTIKKELTEIKNHTIYSSPLQRCSLLANALFDTKEINYDERLKELNFGDWELEFWDNIPENQLTPWMDDFVATRVPNGESYKDLQKRVLKFINEKIFLQENIILVTHAGVIRVIKAYFEDINLRDSFQIKINYGDIFTINV